MNKVNLILNIVLLLATAALYIIFFTGSGKSADSSDNTGNVTSIGSGSIVYINLDSLVNQFDMYNDLRSELQGKLSAIENDLNKQSRALENDIKSFQEKMQKGLLTRSQAESMNNDLAKRDQELQQIYQQKQMEMAEEESVMYNKVMNAITSYMEEYNKSKQYSLILTTTAATNSVITGNAGLNITQEIITGINNEYIKNHRNK